MHAACQRMVGLVLTFLLGGLLQAIEGDVKVNIHAKQQHNLQQNALQPPDACRKQRLLLDVHERSFYYIIL